MNNTYFTELTHNLERAGFTISPEGNDILPVELDGQPLCWATETGGIRWQGPDTADDRRTFLDTVIAIARSTYKYMSQMEAAPQLKADGLEGDFRLLSEFNGTVLAAHPTEYGVQFITWDRTYNRTGLWHGHYYGPGSGSESYTDAKQDFAVRSGLIPSHALFTPDQLTEAYRSITATLDNDCVTPEQQKLLKSAAGQIELTVPDLVERVDLSVQKELEFIDSDTPEHGGMNFC